jgi:hypothetical protein
MEKLSKCTNSISDAKNTLTYAYVQKKKRYSVSNSLGCNNVNEGTERRHSEQKKSTKYKMPKRVFVHVWDYLVVVVVVH